MFLSLRLSDEEAEALRRAAVDDKRPAAALVRAVLTTWLEERGYLPAGGTESPPKPARRPGGRRGRP